MSWRRGSQKRLPDVGNRHTSTVMEDEKGGIALVTEKNQELSEEYEKLLLDYRSLKEACDDMEGKYQETQKENVKVKKHMELTAERFAKEKTGLLKQKDDLNVQIEKLRKEFREKNGKIGDLQRVLVDAQKKADARKEEVQSKTKQNEKLEIIISELQNKVIPELKQKLNKTDANLEVVQKKCRELSAELDKAEAQHDKDDEIIEKQRQEKKVFLEKLARAERDIRALEDARDKAEDQISSLKNSEKTIHERNVKLNADLHSAQGRIKELENDLNRRLAEPELKTYNIDVVESAPIVESAPPGFSFVDDQLREQNELLMVKVKELDDKVKRLEDDNYELKFKLDATSKEVSKWENKYEDESTEKNKIVAQLENEKGNYGRLKDDYSDLKSKLAKAERTIEQGQKEIDRRDRLIEELRGKILLLNNEIDNRDNSIAEHESKLEELNSLIERMHENTLEYQTKYGNLDSDFKVSEQEKESVQNELVDVNRKISELQSKLKESDQEKEYLQRVNADLKQKLLRLEEDFDSITKDKTVFENQAQDWSDKTSKHRKMVENLKTQLKRAQDEAEEYKNDMEQNNNKIDELKDKLDDLKLNYENSQTDLSTARAECDDKDEEIKYLNKKLNDTENEISKLEAQLEKVTKERDNAEVELAGVLEKLQHMEPKRGSDEIKPAEVSYSYSAPPVDFESNLGLLRQRIYELENENNRLKTVEEHLKSDLKNDEDKISSLQRLLKNASLENEEWERKNVQMKNKINALEKEQDELVETNNDLREQLENLRPEVEKLQKKVETLSLERNKLKEYLSDSNVRLTQSKEDYNNKNLDLSEQIKVNSTLGKTVKKHEATVESLSQKCKELEEELEDLRPRLGAALAKNEALESERKELDSRNRKQKQKIDDLQKELQKEIEARELLQQHVDSLTYKLGVAEANNKTLAKQKKDLQSQIDELETKMRKLKPELERMSNTIKEKDRRISRLESELKEKDSKLNDANRKNSNLDETVKSLRKEIEQLKSTNEILRNRIKELETQLKEMGNNMQTVANVSVVHSAPPVSFREERLRSTPDERVHDLEALLKKSEAREDQLRDQLQRYEDRLPRAEADAQKAEDKAIEYQHNYNTVQRKLEELKKMLERANREKEDAKKEVMLCRTQITVLETKCLSDANEMKSLQVQHEQAHQRLKETQEELLSLDEDHVQLRMTCDHYDKEREDHNTVVGRLQGKRIDLEKRVEFLESALKSSKENCDSLKEDKAKLQQELNDLKNATLIDLKRNLTRMQGERDRALEDIKAANTKVEDLEHQLAESQTKRKDVEKDNDELEDEIRQLKNEIEINRKKIEDLEDKIEVLNLELQRDEEDIDELRKTKNGLEDEIASLQVKLAEKHDVIEISPMNVATVDTQYSAAPGFDFGVDPDALSNLEDENLDLKEKLKRGETEKDVLSVQLNDYKTKLGDVDGKNHRLETNLREAENRIKELEKMLNEALEELNQMNDKYQAVERELELLNEDLQDAQNKLSTAASQEATGLAKIKLLQQQLEAASKDEIDKNKEIIEKQRKINELYAIVESGGKDSNSLKQVIEELREDVDSKDRENTKLQKELRHAQDDLLKLRSTLEEMEEQLSETEHDREEFKMMADGLRYELELRDRALEDSQKEVDDARDKLKAATKEIEAIRSQLKQANVSLKAANDEKKILETRIVELQRITEQLRKELAARNTVVARGSGVSEEYLNDLRNKLSEYRQKYQDVSNEKMRLELQLRDKDVRISQVSGPSDTLREERDRLKDEVISLQATIKDNKKNYQKAQRDVENLKREDVFKDNEIQRLEDKIRKLEDEKEKLKKDSSNLEKKNSELKVEHEKLKYEKNRLENELSLQKKKFQALQNQINAVDVPKQLQDVVSRKKYQELEESCQDALREKEKAKSDMAVYRTKMAKLEADLKGRKREKDDLEDEVNRLKNIEADLKKQLQASRAKHKEDKDKALEWRKNNYAPLEQELQRAKGQIKKLEKTNSDQANRIEDLNDDLAHRDKRIAYLEEELENQDDTAAHPLDSVNIDIRGDSQALQDALDEKADLLKELQKFKGRVWTLEHDNDILKTKEEQQENVISEVNKMNDRLKDELRELKKGKQGSRDVLKKENSDLTHQVRTLKEDKDELEKDITSLQEDKNDLKTQNRNLMMENKELKLKRQELEVKLHELEMGLKIAKDDHEKIRDDLLKTQNENADLKDSLNSQSDIIQVQTVSEVESAPPMFFGDDVDGIIRDKDKLKIELEASEDQVKMLQKELEDLQNTNDELQSDLTEVRRKLKEDEAEIKKLDSVLENLHHEIHIANQNNDDIRNEMENLQDLKDKIQAENYELKDENKDLEQRLQSVNKERADLERELKRVGDAPIAKRKPSQDLYNEKERKIKELLEKVGELERENQRKESYLSPLRDENEELQGKNRDLRDENRSLRRNITELENEVKIDNKKIEDLEKDLQELEDMVEREKGGMDSEKEKELIREIDALNDRNNRLQKSLDQAKKDRDDWKMQLDEYNDKFDDNNKQLAVQITALYGGQSELYKKEIEEKDVKIENLQKDKMKAVVELERLKEEYEAAKSTVAEIRKKNDELQKENGSLRDDKTKLDNKLQEEINYNKVKTAELEAEQDILKKKIKDKDDLIKKSEKQIQQLREQLATSVPSDQASTTVVLQRMNSRPREHKMMLSYQDGLMNRPGVYRSSSENSLPNSDVSRSGELDHSELGEVLGKEITNDQGRRRNQPRDHVGEKIDVVESKPTESERDYDSLFSDKKRSSTPTEDEDKKKSGSRDSSYGRRYGSDRERYGSRDRESDRPRDRDRDRDRDRERRSTDRGKERNRAECQQS